MAEANGEQTSAQPATDTTNQSPVPAAATPDVNGNAEQPQAIGGFVVDDDDDDDEEYTPVLSKSQEAGAVSKVNVDQATSNTPNHSAAEVPNNAPHFHEDPSSHSSKDPTDSGVVAHDQSEKASTTTHINSSTLQVGVSSEATVASNPSQNDQNESVPPESAGVSSSENAAANLHSTRLPQDRVGMLEDRIKEDPRGDTEAWLSLIDEHKKRRKFEEARDVYERFFTVFPTAAEQLVTYAQMELDQNNFYQVEQIFTKNLFSVQNVQLWSTYLNYVRRRNDLTNDPTGSARKIVAETYEFVMSNIGMDKDSGPMWQDYVQFIRDGPGKLGGPGWQDQQKMDNVRRVYQRAICIPTASVNALWKEYDGFEMNLNRQTGRKFLQEKSPSYMTARGAMTALKNITLGLDRSTVPHLPPAPGFEGDIEYTNQIEIWKKWIAWEKEDPLVLKDDELATYKARVLYTYKQALIPLRFYPEMWFDAAQFCFSNGMNEEGDDLLVKGTAANPESSLLAFARADRIELTTTQEEGDEKVIKRGAAIREPLNKLLDTLYGLYEKTEKRMKEAVSRIREGSDAENSSSPTASTHEVADADDNDANEKRREEAKKLQVEALEKGFNTQMQVLSKQITFAWIVIMRAMRRVQGQGRGGDTQPAGLRGIFAEARKRGRLTSDFYVANAMLEYYCYKDPVAAKILERGIRLYPNDEHIALEYIKHLISINDLTNARSVFETNVARFSENPDNLPKAKVLFHYFHDFESKYGELSQAMKLEKRIRDLFPDDPHLRLFAERYSTTEYDPTAVKIIVSPSTQTKPKATQALSTEKPLSSQNSPRPPEIGISSTPFMQNNISPKRPLEDSDAEVQQPRKVARSDSPLKGAAGRRLDAQKRTALRKEVMPGDGQPATPAMPMQTPLPPLINWLLSSIPRAEFYNATRFSPEGMVNLLRTVDMSRANLSRPGQQQSQPPPQHAQTQPAPLPPCSAPTYGYQPSNPGYGYGR